MLRAIFNKSRRQNPTKQQLYGHLSPIMKTILVRRTRHVGNCWICKYELISYVLLCTPSHGRAKVGRHARTYIQQLCANAGCRLEDLLEMMDDREGWRERIREISAGSGSWWWWWCNRFNKSTRWPFVMPYMIQREFSLTNKCIKKSISFLFFLVSQ